jgi:methylated-DNA-[protein]-cysteine S-methyltransferase
MSTPSPTSLPATEILAAPPLALELRWKGKLLAEIRLLWSHGLAPSPAPTPLGAKLSAALADYVAGKKALWPSLPLDSSALSGFARDVLFALRDNVGPGMVITYANLAKLAGHPGAARAVGQVMAANPWPLVIPCHRVLASGGGLGGFSGEGLSMKEYLLDLEGAR